MISNKAPAFGAIGCKNRCNFFIIKMLILFFLKKFLGTTIDNIISAKH